MSQLETESQRHSREGRERGRENKESKEQEIDPELQAAATMERADYLVHEVKSNKNQVQNIVLHMQQVLKTIRDLRTALQLPAVSTDDSSISQDKKRVADLKKKIAEFRDELIKMKDDLVAEQVRVLRSEQPTAAQEILLQSAQKMVNEILAEAEKE